MKHKSRNTLTSEWLKRRFSSQFDLVNHAIKLAEDAVLRGNPVLKNDSKNNVAMQILDLIDSGHTSLERNNTISEK